MINFSSLGFVLKENYGKTTRSPIDVSLPLADNSLSKWCDTILVYEADHPDCSLFHIRIQSTVHHALAKDFQSATDLPFREGKLLLLVFKVEFKIFGNQVATINQKFEDEDQKVPYSNTRSFLDFEATFYSHQKSQLTIYFSFLCFSTEKSFSHSLITVINFPL